MLQYFECLRFAVEKETKTKLCSNLFCNNNKQIKFMESYNIRHN